MLDLFNHDATPTVHWNLTQGQWSAVATAPAEAGEELFLDYGPSYWKPAHARMLDDVLYYGAEYKPVLADEPD